ncbi:AMP-binding protein [Curtobacterium sp. TC1]|uniref:phenylacetate--CoA ligase family protein n=1 Tax=Curtobacterium sp. TC1 TaxID=2862880 RepID=UPI001C9B18EA|nr:AMP-binding protein [Curtobacterium sp. TC1]QZQ56494.1 AMP-binding protein [Curtobacterium sp. TC1]
MTDHTTSLARGETWLPRSSAADDFIGRYVEVFEQYHDARLTQEALRAWRSDQLAAVLHKVMGSPFYRKQLRGVDLDSVRPEDLTALPFTTKEDLRRELYDVLSGPLREALYFYETTGTTGRATPCPRDAKEVVASNAFITESWRAIFREHFGAHRPSVGLMGPTEVHSFGDTLGDVAKNLGSCNAKIWPYSPVMGFKRALELMRDLELEVIVATPGVCLNLARAASFHGFDIREDFPSLRLVFTTGEMCTPALARNIESLWGVRCYDILYGSQEAFVMGTAAPSGVMRFSELNYIAEIIDPDSGECLGGRGTGELCVTMLMDGVKPLIRYRTGDLVELSDDDQSDIDQPGPIIKVIGRVADRISLGGSPATASDVEQSVLHGVVGAYGYQVVIDGPADGSEDRVTVRLHFRDGNSSEHVQMLREIERRVRRRFAVECRAEAVDALDEIVSTGAFVSWKAARISDHRNEPGAEEVIAAQLALRRGVTS